MWRSRKSPIGHTLSEMQEENKPQSTFYPFALGDFSAFPFLLSGLPEQAPDYTFLEQPVPLSSPPEQSLLDIQKQMDQFSMNLLASGLMPSGQITPSATLFDPMDLYLSQASALPGQYSLGSPASSLEGATLSDLISPNRCTQAPVKTDLGRYPTSPAPTPVTTAPSPFSSGSTASFSPLPKSKSQPSQRAKRSRESTTLCDDFDPIHPEEDMATRKRRQNTMAARRSRMRKVAKMDELERTVNQLEKDKIQLETRLAVLESEKENANRRAQESLERIHTLEAQLYEAYKSRS
ncbi:hypothetical protein L0F63_005317 [Massospora cicadina]|nr:hypothetical protein L0F63_005317 [Massospora cicadina]